MNSLESSPAARFFCLGPIPFLQYGRRSSRVSGGFTRRRLVPLPHAPDRSRSHMIGLHPLPGRRQREASKGPGGGNEPPGRRHDAGEFRHGGTRPQPAAPHPSDRSKGDDAYLYYRILAHSRVQPTNVARRPRQRSHLSRPSAATSRHHAISHELQRLAASRHVRPLGPAPPSIRVEHIHGRAPLTASVSRRLEARTGKASPSDPRPPRGEPGAVVGRPLQPCPLVIRCPDRLEFPLSSSRRSDSPIGPTHDATRCPAPAPRNFLFSNSSAPAGTSPVSRYFHSATSSFRASATIPTLRSRVFPAANRC
jgi:hypothetical protein